MGKKVRIAALVSNRALNPPNDALPRKIGPTKHASLRHAGCVDTHWLFNTTQDVFV